MIVTSFFERWLNGSTPPFTVRGVLYKSATFPSTFYKEVRIFFLFTQKLPRAAFFSVKFQDYLYYLVFFLVSKFKFGIFFMLCIVIRIYILLGQKQKTKKKKQTDVMFSRGWICVQRYPNILGRSWTLPSHLHLGVKDVAFKGLYGSKEGTCIFLKVG